MSPLDAIIKPVEREYHYFQSLYEELGVADNPLLREVLNHIIHKKGKQMRPILTLLFAKLFGEIGDSTYHSALSLELVHTASLVHDDVIDESAIRRGQPSVNASFGNKIAVLSGDYLSALSMLYMARTNNVQMAKVVGQLAQLLSDGELFQLFESRENVVSEDVYFLIIKKKTAALFSACAKLGALSVDASPEDVEKAAKIGEFIGICFQIRDDIFDYFESSAIGKPTGSDMREGKLTLPVIYAIRNFGNDEIHRKVEQLKAGSLSDSEIHSLIDFAKSHGGIAYAEGVMKSYREKVLALLAQFDNKEIVNAIIAFLDYVIGREK